MSTPETTFAVGDCVTLMHGGVVMTVVAVASDDDGEQQVDTCWHSADGTIQDSTFPSAAMRRAFILLPHNATQHVGANGRLS